jgi:hypothetical protein
MLKLNKIIVTLWPCRNKRDPYSIASGSTAPSPALIKCLDPSRPPPPRIDASFAATIADSTAQSTPGELSPRSTNTPRQAPSCTYSLSPSPCSEFINAYVPLLYYVLHLTLAGQHHVLLLTHLASPQTLPQLVQLKEFGNLTAVVVSQKDTG